MIITLSHQKGGVGKSTIAWNLLVEFSKIKKIYLIDLDIQKTLTSTLNVRNTLKGISNNIVLLNPQKKQDMLDVMLKIGNKKDEILLIDSGGFDSELNRIAIIASNILLTPVSSKFYELLGLQEYEKILKDLSNKMEDNRKIQATIILNKIHPNKTKLLEIEDFINKSEHFNLMSSILRQRQEYEESPSIGESVVEYKSKKQEAKKELISFINELNTIIV